MSAELKLPMFITMAQLQEHVVPWSDDTIRRKIKDRGFPAIQDEQGHYVFPVEDVKLWFKRRTVSK